MVKIEESEAVASREVSSLGFDHFDKRRCLADNLKRR